MENLTITKEAVLRAAEKCGTAKEVLKEMFPEAFEEKHLLSEEFEKGLAKLINNEIEFYDYKKIPGQFAWGKSKTICKLISDTYLK